jgi:hypothetical protein
MKDADLVSTVVSTPREKKFIAGPESNAPAVTFQDDLDAIIVLESDELPNVEDDERLHNDEVISSINKSYLHNFMLIMTTVFSQKDDKELFNDSDNTVVNYFQELSDESKMLYVRLFQRKYKWFRTNNIKYPRISENLQPCFDELIKTGK